MNVWICPDFWVLRPIAASKFCPIKTCFIRENNYCSELRCVKNREVRKKRRIMLKIISDVPVLDMNLGKKLIQTQKTKKSSKLVYISWQKKYSNFRAQNKHFRHYIFFISGSKIQFWKKVSKIIFWIFLEWDFFVVFKHCEDVLKMKVKCIFAAPRVSEFWVCVHYTHKKRKRDLKPIGFLSKFQNVTKSSAQK